MDGAWFVRARWRLKGALLWPAFVAATLADAAVGHALPPTGETQTVAAAALAGLVLNTLGLVLLTRPLAALVRRVRTDLPSVVARNYAGTVVVVAITAAMLALGLHHHSVIESHRSAMRDATARAQAWIGDHAPPEFRRNLASVSTFAIEPGSIYRTCVDSAIRARTYCVIVKTRLPFSRSVSFAGYEPNSDLSAGTG
jgi:hypothetical protein